MDVVKCRIEKNAVFSFKAKLLEPTNYKYDILELTIGL